MICAVVMTDGRMECLVQTVASLEENLTGLEITRRVIHDDSGDPRTRRWINEQFPTWELIATGERQGFAGAYHSARKWLAAATSEPFIWSTEDDFVFTRPLDLAPYAYVLNGNPYLLQMAAKRQAWSDAEILAGGVVEQYPEKYVERDSEFAQWLEHRLFWTTNPHLTHRETLSVEWPEG